MSAVRIPPLRKGELTRFGYSSTATEASRHASLLEASREYGIVSVIRKLNALYVLNKNRAPERAMIFREDQRFLSAHHKQSKGKGVRIIDPTVKNRVLQQAIRNLGRGVGHSKVSIIPPPPFITPSETPEEAHQRRLARRKKRLYKKALSKRTRKVSPSPSIMEGLGIELEELHKIPRAKSLGVYHGYKISTFRESGNRAVLIRLPPIPKHNPYGGIKRSIEQLNKKWGSNELLFLRVEGQKRILFLRPREATDSELLQESKMLIDRLEEEGISS